MDIAERIERIDLQIGHLKRQRRYLELQPALAAGAHVLLHPGFAGEPVASVDNWRRVKLYSLSPYQARVFVDGVPVITDILNVRPAPAAHVHDPQRGDASASIANCARGNPTPRGA